MDILTWLIVGLIEQARGPTNDPSSEHRDVLVGRRRQRVKADRAIGLLVPDAPPSAVAIAHVNSPPPSIVVIAPRFIGATGVGLLVCELLPSWPCVLNPQHFGSPLARRARV